MAQILWQHQSLFSVEILTEIAAKNKTNIIQNEELRLPERSEGSVPRSSGIDPSLRSGRR